jgi:hypothetical protein
MIDPKPEINGLCSRTTNAGGHTPEERAGRTPCQ